MRPEYDGVKYYSARDWSLGDHFERATVLIDSMDINKKHWDINEIIELYNVNQIVLSPGIKNEYSLPYHEKAKALIPLIARYFHSIDDSTFIDLFHSVCIDYLDDFWDLFDKYKTYENVSDSVFERLLNEPETTINPILEHKGIVKHYDKVLARFMRQSDQSARIIVGKFLEKNPSEAKVIYYFPDSLRPGEYEGILDKYIDSDYSNVGVLQLIESSRSTAECPISDTLRLKARKKAREFWNTQAGKGIEHTYGIGVCFKSNPEIVSYKEIKPFEYQFNYDIDWIQENLDFPTLLNNFIYLFGFVDLCYRCTFVSIKTKIGTIESLLGIKGINEYETGTSFRFADMKSSAEMHGYSSLLLHFNIRVEDVIQWFFTEYLKTEFKADGFVINMPSQGSTTLEKCRILPSEMDGIFKQYKMYVTDRSIDRELLEMSSNPVRFQELPSMIEKKYAYANSKEILREQYLLFSDQSPVHYLPNHKEARNFDDLLTNNTITIAEFPKWAIDDLRWLESRNDITVDNQGIIHVNTKRLRLLKDLYYHEVICVSYYGTTALLDNFVASGDLRFESSLFSIPEQKYLNYMLNKSEYSNGLDLRNKYIHSTYPTNINQQENDYVRLLKIMILVVLKINEEFCLSNPDVLS